MQSTAEGMQALQCTQELSSHNSVTSKSTALQAMWDMRYVRSEAMGRNEVLM